MSADNRRGRYDLSTVLEAEGARVALMTCLLCGAAILRDPRDEEDAANIHDRWHQRTRPTKAAKVRVLR